MEDLLKEVKANKLFALVLDEASDISNKEQLSFCLRIVDSNNDIREEFLNSLRWGCNWQGFVWGSEKYIVGVWFGSYELSRIWWDGRNGRESKIVLTCIGLQSNKLVFYVMLWYVMSCILYLKSIHKIVYNEKLINIDELMLHLLQETKCDALSLLLLPQPTQTKFKQQQPQQQQKATQ